MPYVTTPIAPHIKQISLDDVLNNTVDLDAVLRSRGRATRNNTLTRTYYYPNDVPYQYYEDLKLDSMIEAVKYWNQRYEHLTKVYRHELYTEFRIPKASGGMRKIDAPVEELKLAMRELKDIFETIYNPGYHTSAFAYIPGRNPLDAVKRHQMNKSWWFLKTDFSDFFGSSTPEFVWRMLTDIFPFSEVVKSPVGERELKKALDLCFLDGGLPQGNPISPWLTNVIMIPIDFRFARDFRNNNNQLWDGNHFVYTRYADDIDISCKGSFSWRDVIAYMRRVLAEFGAPYRIKDEKTHYGSRNGRNWILGLMLNKDNKITIGHKKKKDYRAMIHNYMTKRNQWTLDDVQYTMGITSYYRSIEPDYIQKMVDEYKNKFGINYEDDMKRFLAGQIC